MIGRRIGGALVALFVVLSATGERVDLRAQADTAPLIVVETSQGNIVFVTFPNEAPLTVAHILDLVKRGFYDGQRIHRAIPGFVIQFGDPQSRNRDARAAWGRGAAASSGTPIGVAEVTKRRPNLQGAVGIAHMGEPAKADSQIYITLARRADLDGRYAVFGQVVDGSEILSRIQVGDEIRRVYIRE